MEDEDNKKEENILSFEERKQALKDNLENRRKIINEATSDIDEERLLKEMNDKHAFIDSYGGKPMVMCHVFSVVDNKNVIEFRTPDAIVTQYSNQSVKVGREFVELGRWWIRHAGRRTYSSIMFDPDLPEIHNNCYNLYTGLNVKPEKGQWWKTLRHLYKVLCNSNRAKFEYTIKWFAWCLQNPGRPAEVVMIFKGKQGAGKGFIFSQFVEIFGDHGLHISNRKHLTGDFNGHLANCVFLFADEAYYPGDKEVGGALNQLITEKKIATERKRMDVIKTKNCLHIGMATNEEWVIPASGGDARRYFINRVEDKYSFRSMSSAERKTYFDNLWGEMDKGGRAAMAYDLLNMSLGDWHPRFNIPYTEEFRNQSMISLSGMGKIIAGFLDMGEFPGDCEMTGETYTAKLKSIDDFLANNVNNIVKKFSPKLRAEYYRKIGGKLDHTKSGINWKFPTLKKCKEAFLDNVSKDYIFENMELEWSTGTESY